MSLAEISSANDAHVVAVAHNGKLESEVCANEISDSEASQHVDSDHGRLPYPELLQALTLEEKVALLSGSDFVRSTGIPRLDIPPLKIVDSINGVKGSDLHHGTPTAVFPSSTLYGSTWNNALMEELGACLAQQAKLKSAQVILGPTINIHRDPRGGRNFECFSEDPLLSGQLAAAIVRGIQSQGLAACPKHFACNESEFKRRSYDVAEDYNGRTVREIYLAAFQELLRGCEPAALMISYNKLNGVHTTESPFLKDMLRDEWKYNGCLVSDWFATKSTAASMNAGLDLEMPGPTVFRGQRLIDAVRDGLVEEKAVDESAARVLALVEAARSSVSGAPERSEIRPETNALALRIASEGIVLLKSDHYVLPLDMRRAPKIAVVGVPATEPVISGGGSASAPPQYIQRPLDCLREAHPVPSLIQYVRGVNTNRIVPTVPLAQTMSQTGEPGFDIAYYNSGCDEPAYTERQAVPVVAMVRDLKPGLEETGFRYEISTTITPASTGVHTLAARVTGAFLLFVDNELVGSLSEQAEVSMEDFLFEPARLEHRISVPMVAGKSYHVRLVTNARIPKENDYEPTPHGAVLCYEEYVNERASIAEAVQAASSADVSIIFAGRNHEYESEGFDLVSNSLPDAQVKLIKAVAAVSHRTVLVLNCGNPINVSPFVDDVDAVLNAHFPGQEGGQAVTDILTGKTNPSGRLATTWPKQFDQEHVPSFDHFPARLTDDGYKIQYAEGVQVGYRHPGVERTAQWQFGFGLSYTTFEYSELVISEVAHASITVSIGVKNTGIYPGHEVVQAFVVPPKANVWRPARELKGYAKVWLLPGEARRVSIELQKKDAFSYWDEAIKQWKVEAGTYRLVAGPLSEAWTVEKEVTWSGR
ncbi:glycoside hydrolase family 3 protein [Aspergillus mulundensis]|uniref:beta-glucosidase n=1 Tax=Aspergillus mulundensis TaxID=1810919 RepID=A0A3D8SLC9_9EURO|nr:Beta-glucosidase [Aspergillus mulundensis]RDW87086.1 Beta-glucosidase [Aspergillus mulundensis]